MNFTNTYSHLDSAFFQRILPTPVSTPTLLLWNDRLADELQLPASFCADRNRLAQYFSGNELPAGAEAIAMAYAGHQFGQFNPQLGDGRAHLLGEVIDRNNSRRDIQLKGSGRTAFSRMGDGRCALGPAIREYLMSEAMAALNVPTSRCLAVVATGDFVYRETLKPGAVVTRVAASHIRVGTFQYFAARGDLNALKSLTDYAIARHFPAIDSHAKANAEHRVVQFLEQVVAKQVALIVAWMRVGFIHGVMNTDNTAISGETIDFGPCAMMGIYHPDTVFSSIDRQGRYAFGNQPRIAQWNMARLAECLLPLVDEDDDKALAKIAPLIAQFAEQFDQAYYTMMSHKLGLADSNNDDSKTAVKTLVDALLTLMQQQVLDYTHTFLRLTQSLDDEGIAATLNSELGDWFQAWQSQLTTNHNSIAFAKVLMAKNNPVVIPRNHHIEAVLAACETTGEMATAERMLNVLHSPYEIIEATADYQDLPVDGDRNYRTFCGT